MTPYFEVKILLCGTYIENRETNFDEVRNNTVVERLDNLCNVSDCNYLIGTHKSATHN